MSPSHPPGVVAKVQWSGRERAKERQGYRILCPAERTGVTRKNICVIIYYLERKIEISRRAAGQRAGDILMTTIRVPMNLNVEFLLNAAQLNHAVSADAVRDVTM